MTYLVTGGSGFTGRRVVKQLVDTGHQIKVLCRSDEAARTISELGAVPLAGDLDDPTSTREAFDEANAKVLVNVASLGFSHTPTIISATENAGIDRAVFVSTTAIFTKLNAPSKAVRVAAEESIQASGVKATIIRPTMIYGAPGDRNLERLVGLLRRTSVLPIPGSGQNLQQPIHVDDLATAIVATALADELPEPAYNVAGPEAVTFRQIIEQTAGALDRKVRVVPIPLGPVRGVLGLYEWLTSTPRLKVEQIDRLEEDKAFDIANAGRDLGFAPRSFAKGVAEEVRLLAEQDR